VKLDTYGGLKEQGLPHYPSSCACEKGFCLATQVSWVMCCSGLQRRRQLHLRLKGRHPPYAAAKDWWDWPIAPADWRREAGWKCILVTISAWLYRRSDRSQHHLSIVGESPRRAKREYISNGRENESYDLGCGSIRPLQSPGRRIGAGYGCGSCLLLEFDALHLH